MAVAVLGDRVLLTLFLVSLAAAVAVGAYTFGVLFGTWSRPPVGPFVAPPPPPPQVFVPVAPVAAPPPPALHAEQATALSSVFVTVPMPHEAVPAPAVTAGHPGNPASHRAPRGQRPAPLRRAQRPPAPPRPERALPRGRPTSGPFQVRPRHAVTLCVRWAGVATLSVILRADSYRASSSCQRSVPSRRRVGPLRSSTRRSDRTPTEEPIRLPRAVPRCPRGRQVHR